MVMGPDFSDVFLGNGKPRLVDFMIIFEPQNVALELSGFLPGVGKFIKIDFQRGRVFGLRPAS